MAQVNILRHNPIAIFSNHTEIIVKDDKNQVFRLVEPSGNVGTQYPNDLGAEWFGTSENLNNNLKTCGVEWSDVYKTDVLWTTPSTERDTCDQVKDDFNAIYAPMINSMTGCSINSNRMARFTHPEGFPDPVALFEVQIKAVRGENVSVNNGVIDYGYWQDHQPSGASVMHSRDGKTITSIGPNLAEEMAFVMFEHYEKPFAEAGVDFKKQTVWMEILVAVDDDPEKTWERIEIVRRAFEEYYGNDRPSGLIYPVSRIPNLDGIVEPQPRVVAGDVSIDRSGEIENGFATWTTITYGGITEVMTSAVGGIDAGVDLLTLDSRIKEAGGKGLKEDGVFNNAYVVAGPSSQENRDRLKDFNTEFSGWYEGTAPAGRTAQYVGGIQQASYQSGISNRAIYCK